MTMTDYFLWHDHLHADKDHGQEAALVLAEMARLSGVRPSRLIEIGCGTGSHTLAMDAEGLAVTACDTEDAAVAVARQKGCEHARFYVGSILDVEESGFDGAYALSLAMNAVPNLDGLTEVLLGLRDRLKPGAPFLFDCWNGIAALRDPPQVREVRLADHGHDVTVLTVPTIDPMEQAMTVERTFNGTTETGETVSFVQSYRHRLWTPRELKELLWLHGFEVERVCAWMTPERPATAEDWKLMFVCRTIETEDDFPED